MVRKCVLDGHAQDSRVDRPAEGVVRVFSVLSLFENINFMKNEKEEKKQKNVT